MQALLVVGSQELYHEAQLNFTRRKTPNFLAEISLGVWRKIVGDVYLLVVFFVFVFHVFILGRCVFVALELVPSSSDQEGQEVTCFFLL